MISVSHLCLWIIAKSLPPTQLTFQLISPNHTLRLQDLPFPDPPHHQNFQPLLNIQKHAPIQYLATSVPPSPHSPDFHLHGCIPNSRHTRAAMQALITTTMKMTSPISVVMLVGAGGFEGLDEVDVGGGVVVEMRMRMEVDG